eukprot:m.20531 g.20531  ORF g.20531 m.20531 type:complete len:342 (-) comp10235_c0_seq1:2195-3220(-)
MATESAVGSASGNKAILVDGGMGHMLRRLGVTISGPIGSQQRFLGVALANTEKPELVTAAHRAYIAAGADVITTNNYSVVPATLGLVDVLELPSAGHYVDADLGKLVGLSARIAREAVDAAVSEGVRAVNTVRVAGCVPPLRESYRHEQVPPADEMAAVEAVYQRIVTALVSGGVDLILIESMSCSREAVAAMRAATVAAPDTEVWVSYTLAEDESGALRSGEPIEDAIADLASAKVLSNVSAVLFNCTSAASITAALPRVTAALATHAPNVSIRVGGYANGFVTTDSDGGGSDYCNKCTPSTYAAVAVDGWVKQHGASVIGGCCGVFPEHIEEMRRQIDL